jgi:hypothetical protein
MNVEIGAEATLFPEKEYISGIFVAVQSFLQGTRIHTTGNHRGRCLLLFGNLLIAHIMRLKEDVQEIVFHQGTQKIYYSWL